MEQPILFVDSVADAALEILALQIPDSRPTSLFGVSLSGNSIVNPAADAQADMIVASARRLASATTDASSLVSGQDVAATQAAIFNSYLHAATRTAGLM